MDLIWGFYLGLWGWVTTFFVIIFLVASVALVVWLMRPVLWVLPGIVLYWGLHWEMPGPLEMIFRIVFWGSVIVAVVTAVLPVIRTHLARVPLVLMLGLIVWCLVLGLMTWLPIEDWEGVSWLWYLIFWMLVIALVLWLLKHFLPVGAVLVAFAVLLGLVNWLVGINDVTINGPDQAFDACVTVDGVADPEIQPDDTLPKGLAPIDTEAHTCRTVTVKHRKKDLCPNLEGRQRVIPQGYVIARPWHCVKRSVVIARAVNEAMREQGFKPDEYSVDRIDWYIHVIERQDAFSGQTLKTREDVYDFLAGDGHGSRMARGEVERALGGRHFTACTYVPVQFKVPVQYRGNLYLRNREIITPDGLRQAQPGDVVWLCVVRDKVIWRASIRADCGNPRFLRIIPVRPGMRSRPPVSCTYGCRLPRHHHSHHTHQSPSHQSGGSGSGGAVTDLEAKSSDARDYVVEQGAPKAEADGHASSSSSVTTQSSGGHQVTDSPTRSPGSETGVQAPSASPAPSTSPSVPPEAGANTPSAGASSCVPPPGMTTC